LIKNIFVVNPDLRLTITQIKQHAWTHLGVEKPQLHAFVKEPIRADIVARMENEFGMPLELVVKSLQDDEVNHLTATYRMLRKKPAQRSAKGDDLAAVTSAIKKAEVNNELSLSSIMSRRKERKSSVAGANADAGGPGGGPPGLEGSASPKSLARSLSGRNIANTRSRSRSRSGLLLGSHSPRNNEAAPAAPAVLGGGVQQHAWHMATPSTAATEGAPTPKLPRGGLPRK
jgi:hypothetical protein